MDAPSLSVIVCSAGRPDLLGGCLDSLLALPGWDRRDEVVVVLNGPDRATSRATAAARTGRAADQAVPIRLEELERTGLSAARNRGIEIAGGEVLVFLDDDARPAPPWLDGWRHAFAADGNLAAAGGPIESRWPDRPPRWFDPDLAAYWSELDHPDVAAAARAPIARRGFGANVAMRAARLQAIGGFDERLGRGGPVPGGEETDVLRRLDQEAGTIGWVPSARVVHLVEPHRTRLVWLARRAYDQGIVDRALGGAPASPVRVVTTGWPTLVRRLRADRAGWRRHLAVDLARRCRLAGRSRVTPRR